MFLRRAVAFVAPVLLVFSAVPVHAQSTAAPAGDYIVTFRDTVHDSSGLAAQLERQHGFVSRYVYEHALNGFAAPLPTAAITALRRNPNVARVEADAGVTLGTSQTDPTWGLDRIDQRTVTLDKSYTYDTTGAGVTAYVIDSGIDYEHQEFATNRAVYGTDVVGGIEPAGSDCNGHGTHVAGTIGGRVYGVAKEVQLVSVRVFGCDGGSSWSTIIAGLDWVVGHHPAGAPAVANMSLSGPSSASMDDATRSLIADGVATAVAAGNGNWLGREDDACKYSPARVAEAMTVSATDKTDTKASWANYGSCVDWFAPGVGVVSAAHDSTSATSTKSGTSMASPHTAGVAALYLEAHPGASPAAVTGAIAEATTKGVVGSSRTANNHLLFSLIPNSAPTAADVSASGETGQVIGWSPAVSDADLDALSCSIVAQSPSGGIATVDADCAGGTYSPSEGFSGTATFEFSVTDGEASDTGTVTISVTAPGETQPAGIDLSVRPYKVKGWQRADLSWSGATGDGVDLYRNGTKIITTQNDGFYTDVIDSKGGGSYTYQVCEAGTGVCSETVTVSY